MSDFDEFDEFDQPNQSEKARSVQKPGLAESFPQCKALVEDLRASYPELFASAKVIHMVERDTGLEHSTREYRLVSHFMPLSARQFLEFGRLSKLNQAATSKRGSSSKRTKYVIVPGYVSSRHDQQRHYVSAPVLADLYKVDFQACRVFMRTGDRLADEAAWNRFKDDGYVFLRPDYTGKYQLPGDDNGR